MTAQVIQVTDPRHIQIHALTPYSGVLLNRDDAGRAKRQPGTYDSIRVSSQCERSHWRHADGEWSLASLGAMSVRSRVTFRTEIAEPLVRGGLRQEIVVPILAAFQAKLLGESAKAVKEKKEAEKGEGGEKANEKAKGKGKGKGAGTLESLDTNQVIVLGRPEIDFIRAATAEIASSVTSIESAEAAVLEYLKRNKGNLDALVRASGLDAALFGRMVTSDYLSRGDSAIHVAHSFTVHEEMAEPDYFTAVDELRREAGESGAGMVGETELTTGLFYKYIAIDVPLLVSNLEGVAQGAWAEADRDLAARVVEHLIHLIACVSPGAKLGSTAPYSYADFILVEAGQRAPRTLAGAFLNPVPSSGDLLRNTLGAVSGRLDGLDRMYGRREDRRFAAVIDPGPLAAEPGDGIDGVAAWAADMVRGVGR